MYNGIGLQTARGSGTSGYVQKNLSYVKPYAQIKQRDDFLKGMQALKDNVLAPPKKANKDILLHQQKRDIQLQLLKIREKLEQEGKPADEIEERVKKAEKILNDKLASGELELASTNDYHKKALEKEKEYERVRNAFQMSSDYKPGSAFDFEGQERKRLEEKFEREVKKTEQRRQERKQEKEKIKALEAAGVPAIEAEKQVLGTKSQPEVKRTNEEKRKQEREEREEREERRREQRRSRRSPPRDSHRHRERSRSPRNERRKDREGKGRDEREKEKEKEKERTRKRSTSEENVRAKERSKDRERERSREKNKEDIKKKEKGGSREKEKEKEKEKRRDKSSSSSERSDRDTKRKEKQRRRHDSSESSSKSRSRSSSSGSDSSGSSRSD